MSTLTEPEILPAIVYPESDGKPMADNTLQFRWIVTIKENLETLFAEQPDVFIAGDLLWYPVEGRPTICTAPDVLAVFGRPKGDRGSYLQWREGNTAPQVVFEILSPTNTPAEMSRKISFYQRYGVEEYYLYDPHSNLLLGWRREEAGLAEIEPIDGFVSPRLGIRMARTATTLIIERPDGQPFLTFGELQQRAEQEHARAEQEHARAEQERTRAEQEYVRAERLAQRLREAGIDPDQI